MIGALKAKGCIQKPRMIAVAMPFWINIQMIFSKNKNNTH